MEIKPEEKLIKSMDLTRDEVRNVRFFGAKGCEKCRYTGFKGRIAIFEYLHVDEDIRKEIVGRSSTEKIKKTAVEKGMLTLRQDGWRKVKAGITTIQEVLKVTLEN